jgi:hypothetical protein
MKKAAEIFYSLLATCLMLEFLLTAWMVIFYEKSLRHSPFVNIRDIAIRILILVIIATGLFQVYLLHMKGKSLNPMNYWMLLALNSACSIYLKYASEFISHSYLKINTAAYAVSFFTWLMILLLGVCYRSVFNTPAARTNPGT